MENLAEELIQEQLHELPRRAKDVVIDVHEMIGHTLVKLVNAAILMTNPKFSDVKHA